MPHAQNIETWHEIYKEQREWFHHFCEISTFEKNKNIKRRTNGAHTKFRNYLTNASDYIIINTNERYAGVHMHAQRNFDI